MTQLAGVTPTVQVSGLPAPSAAPAAAPATGAPTGDTAAAPLPNATPADVAHGSDSPTSPVSAAAAASAAAQTAEATRVANEAAALAATATPVTVTVQTTGNEAFDQVGRMLADKGVANASEILTAASNGELSLADKAAIVQALGPDVANLAMAQLDGEVARQKDVGTAQATGQKDYADKLMGGKEGSWEQLQEFARSAEAGFTPADQKAIQEMLDEGGVKGEWAIDQIAARYQKSQGFTQVPNLLTGDGPTLAGFEPLSKANYVSEMRAAQEKHGEGSREVEALRQRRTISRQRGF